MNAMLSIIVKLGLAALSALPVERIVALLLNRLLAKAGDSNVEKVAKTAQHLAELSALFGDIVSDRSISPEEISALRASIIRARERLLAEWSLGSDGKALQGELGKVGLVAEYTETSSAQNARL